MSGSYIHSMKQLQIMNDFTESSQQVQPAFYIKPIQIQYLY